MKLSSANQTSANFSPAPFYNRSIPISRLQIQQHVDIQHIDSAGLTPVMSLFNPGAPSQSASNSSTCSSVTVSTI